MAQSKSEEPAGYVVSVREPGARTWKLVGWSESHAGAVRLIDGAGDWHLQVVHDPRLLPNVLPLG